MFYIITWLSNSTSEINLLAVLSYEFISFINPSILLFKAEFYRIYCSNSSFRILYYFFNVYMEFFESSAAIFLFSSSSIKEAILFSLIYIYFSNLAIVRFKLPSFSAYYNFKLWIARYFYCLAVSIFLTKVLFYIFNFVFSSCCLFTSLRVASWTLFHSSKYLDLIMFKLELCFMIEFFASESIFSLLLPFNDLSIYLIWS